MTTSAPLTGTAAWPVAVLLFSASLWGLSWWPIKYFAGLGLSGPVLVMLSYGLVGLGTAWLLWRERGVWRAQAGLVLALAVVGGWANTSFVSAMLMGDVVRVMFLFYLSPVWAVLGGWLLLKERVPLRRALAVLMALPGLWLVIGAGDSSTWSLGAADWLALSAGLAFAGNNLLARAGQAVPMRTKTVAVFMGCGVLSLLAVLWQGLPVPTLPTVGWLALLGYGFGWMLLATATWQYGVTHLESGRAGVVLLAELVVAVLSAAWFGEAELSAREWAGGALIATAALLEALDTGTSTHPTQESHA